MSNLVLPVTCPDCGRVWGCDSERCDSVSCPTLGRVGSCQPMSERIIIVSRHPAAVEFIAREIGGIVSPSGLMVEFAAGEPVRVLPQATPDQVRGKVVYGNLPLNLACLAQLVWAIEFAGAPPRGQEYDLAAMDAAGARLVEYRVTDETARKARDLAAFLPPAAEMCVCRHCGHRWEGAPDGCPACGEHGATVLS